MSSGEKYGIAAELFALAFGVIQQMTGGIPPFLGWSVVVACVITGVVLITRGRQGRNLEQKRGLDSQETIGKKDAVDERRSSSWKGLSEAEFAQVQAAVISMSVYHGHVDFNGLIDDQKHGKPLNGLCWRCGKPRFEKGDPPK